MLQDPSPNDHVSDFFIGFRLVDSSTGLTFIGSDQTLNAKMEHYSSFVFDPTITSEPSKIELPLVSCTTYEDYIRDNYGEL